MVESEACHGGCGNRLPLDDVERTEPRLCERCWWRGQLAAWRAGGPVHDLARTLIERHAADLEGTDDGPRAKQRKELRERARAFFARHERTGR